MGDARSILPNVIVAVLFHRNGGGLRVFNSSKVCLGAALIGKTVGQRAKGHLSSREALLGIFETV